MQGSRFLEIALTYRPYRKPTQVGELSILRRWAKYPEGTRQITLVTSEKEWPVCTQVWAGSIKMGVATVY